MRKHYLSVCVYGNAFILIVLAFYFFLVPLATITANLRDPGLRNGRVPRFAYQWHRHLSARFEPWARQRVASGQASSLSLTDFSGTEWPIFSAVYYLWATEALQQAWEADPSLAPTMPAKYAKEAIEAAAALVADPNHATWVQKHWGDDYLHQENVFYRMLLISGLTSYQNLLDDKKYEAVLADQVHSLAAELEASPYGLLDDYPNQCYPIDILPAVAAIQRADPVINQDHSIFVIQSVRAFSGTRLDNTTQLPTYIADAKTGIGYGPARGVGISYMLIWVPELWPDVAERWYGRYEEHFWQTGTLVTAVREFSRHRSAPDWWLDVDAGPVMGGYGTAATAFGIGAARANGRFDHAFPLSAEALVVAWPLPNGTLLGPRLLSNFSDAPYVGEAALLFNFTRQPLASNLTIPERARLPLFVYLALFVYLLMGCLGILIAGLKVVCWRRLIAADFQIKNPELQLAIWLLLLLLSTLLLGLGHAIFAILGLLFIQFFPHTSFKPSEIIFQT